MPHPTNFFLPQYQSALGTVVHATPLVELLKRSLPQARVVVASSGLAEQVWQENPHLERLLHTPNPLHDPVGAVRALRAARMFVGERYVTLLTTGNERTKITLAAALAGRSRRIGFAVHGALVQQHLAFDSAQSQIENNLRLLAAAGVPRDPAWPTEPRLYPGSADRAFAETLLQDVRRPRIALATQTSPTQRKSWSQERWVELAQRLRSLYGAELVFIGAPAETEAIDVLRAKISCSTTSAAGRTSIPQLAAVLKQCDLGIMLDTGPLHVARGVNLPAVIIAPAWSPVHEWLPVGHPRYRILKNADFPAPAPDDYIIDEVSVGDVLAATSDLLATARPAASEEGRTPES
ncbi:glycosyltransferase family 9 protein [Terriglobus aquaticus]|uniref:Glycosyltransferase family 9 protein n=1 Tax=Terriglobus aquaticus TaxID=940139 RepID=A0ABW9KMB1_9BACT|nr:glycosyltransferase family 9 protein [Terriglobus aquaticus]